MENKKYDFLSGEVLLIDKPKTWTSFDVVNKVRGTLKRHLNVKKLKVGHAGTLDPLATGLLILCTGKKTKEIEQIARTDKEYIAEIEFGATTPSFDNETEKNNEFPFEHISIKDIEQILKEKFNGEIEQYPPAFSAKRVNGVRAYKIARSGEQPELKASLITIFETEILNYSLPILQLRIKCSKGTYIRSLANDIGLALKSGAYLTKLERTKIGDYNIKNAMSMEDFQKIIENNTINK